MQLDQEFIKWVIAQAIGLVIAVIIFYAYKELNVQSKEQQRLSFEQLKIMNDVLIKVVAENTGSNQKLIVMIENQERNMMRKSDLEALLEKYNKE